jgi:hypothetical protein
MKTMYNPAPSTQERSSLAISSANKLVMGGLSPLQWRKTVSLPYAEDFTTLIHLTLRHENPFGDRPLKFVSQELFQCWEITLSSLYQAISKLNNKSVLLNHSGQILIDWEISSFSLLPSDYPKNAKSLILRDQTYESVIFIPLSNESLGGERIEINVF